MGGRITLLPKLHCMGEPTQFIDFLTKRSEPFTWLSPPGQLQWRIQGRGPGSLAPPYFSTKFFFQKKNFKPPPPPPRLSQGLDEQRMHGHWFRQSELF